jgi:hypothetical protein
MENSKIKSGPTNIPAKLKTQFPSLLSPKAALSLTILHFGKILIYERLNSLI